jgi:hypothetical protein
VGVELEAVLEGLGGDVPEALRLNPDQACGFRVVAVRLEERCATRA